LGSYGLLDPDEPLYGETAREMIVLKDWLSPRMNFTPWFDKPILFYWEVILAFKLFGVNEFAARFWSALLGVGGLFLTYRLSLLLFASRRKALFSGLILASSFGYIVLARASVTDMTLCFLISFALFAFYWGFTRPDGRWAYWGIYLFGALAALTKGPMGILIPFGVIGTYLFLTRRLGEIRRLHPLGGGLLLLAIATPWYAAMYVLYGAKFGNTFLIEYNLGRFLKPEHMHRSYFYYLPVLLLGLLPWGFFFPSAFYRVARRWRDPRFLFLLVWFSFVFLFFSVAESKLPSYLLPLFPPAAMILGYVWEEASAAKGDLQLTLSSVGVLFLGAGFFVLPHLSTKLSGRYPTAVDRAQILGGIVVIMGGVILLLFARRRWTAAFYAHLALMLLVVPTLLIFVMPEVERYVSTRALALQVAHPNASAHGVASFRYYRPSLTFYTRQVIHRLDEEKDLVRFLDSPEEVYCFMRRQDFEDFQRSHPDVPVFLKEQEGEVVLVSNWVH
jgi:4-amino-4-deoxy-L-arabinose transferase-like glycosyltransferase